MMSIIKAAFFLSLFSLTILHAQILPSLKGLVFDAQSKQALVKAKVQLVNTSHSSFTDVNGSFIFIRLPLGKQFLKLEMTGYDDKIYEVILFEDNVVDLGIIFLDPKIPELEGGAGLISLSEEELLDEQGQSDHISGLLQSSKDLYQNRAAFDWGQTFFRVRGYDSKHAEVLLNGISMNSLFNGRAGWNHWGGLNDMMRNQELSSGLAASSHTFGGLLGSINISTRASLYRPGLKLTSSFANKSYTGRLMLNYNSGLSRKGLAYSFSASRRWANEGSFKGALYDAYSFFSALEYKINAENSLNLSFVLSPNKRGQIAPITARVFQEMGRKYNPYWGLQNGKVRNSRIRKILAPILFFTHTYQAENILLSTGLAYQISKQSSSRLDYINAANPIPNYWRYLDQIKEKPQIDWQQLVQSNRLNGNIEDAGLARYLLYEDRIENQQLSLNINLNSALSPQLIMDLGATYKGLISTNYAQPIDLLGALNLADSNPFTIINGHAASNDLLGEPLKKLNDKIKYNYQVNSTELSAFAQWQYTSKKVDFFLSTAYVSTKHQRDGKFLNESFIDSSFGKSKALSFTDLKFKSGFTYKISGRHLFILHAAYLTKAPFIRNSFINARENNHVVKQLQSEKVQTLDLNYIYRSSLIKLRVSTYYSAFYNGTDINYFFAQGGSGTDFFQEVLTKINTRHIGLEYGLELQASTMVKLFLAGTVGQHTYTDNAHVAINFDTASDPSELINTVGFKDLGASRIKGLKLSNGPQQAFSLGFEYRDPNFWWLGLSANYLSNAYVDISTINRTDDFFKDPDNPFGLPFEDIDLAQARELLRQEKFKPVYLLNLVGGKSWRLKDKYLSFFLSLNNAFEQDFKTGGYEQSRAANYAALLADQQKGEASRSFGNKYWYGPGRTYFLNLALSF